MHYLIYVSEDGDVSVTEYKKEDLLRAIKDRDYGDLEFMCKLVETDPQYWGGKSLIIEGKIVSPRPVQVVTEYEL